MQINPNQYLRKTEFNEDSSNSNLIKTTPNLRNNNTQSINLPMNLVNEITPKDEDSPDSDEEVFVYNFFILTNLINKINLHSIFQKENSDKFYLIIFLFLFTLS